MVGSKLKSMARHRQGVYVACALLATLAVACDAFDRGQLMPPVGGGGGTGGSSDLDGGADDGGVCAPSTEICDGVDDDCDGIPDSSDVDADEYCRGIVLNIPAGCVPSGPTEALCARLRLTCNPGWSNCDGLPSNGCETPGASCRCRTCDDAGGDEEDAGF